MRSSLPLYDIIAGDDEAFAYGIENAIAAARQLVVDGNAVALVYLAGREIGQARAAERGEGVCYFSAERGLR